jgi:hypothetical protein
MRAQRMVRGAELMTKDRLFEALLLRAAWFQKAPQASSPANSRRKKKRRNFADSAIALQNLLKEAGR